MFLRIDTDLFVNINNILGFKIFDEGEAFKLSVWGTSGSVTYSVFYLKDSPEQMELLTNVVKNLKEFTINPEVHAYQQPKPETTDGPSEPPKRRINELLDDDNPDVAVESAKEDEPVQLSLFDVESQITDVTE